MTPEEWYGARVCGHYPLVIGTLCASCAIAVIGQAVAAEREACARIAQAGVGIWEPYSPDEDFNRAANMRTWAEQRSIALAIRARVTPSSVGRAPAGGPGPSPQGAAGQG